MFIRNNNGNRLAMAISATLAGLGGGAVAYAQSTGPQLEEIVVTARKTEESLQDVPIAVTAFTAEAMEAAGIKNVVDIAAQTPGFSFNQAFGRTGAGEGGAGSRPSIRGMSNILGTANASFFVDGIYVSGNVTSYQLDNLERVEVIRGPQSALFGRQTFGGAINFITRKPGDEFRGQLNATVGQHDHYEGSGFVSGPIIPGKLAGELNARYYTFGGDYDNTQTGKRDINAQQTTGVGGKLRFTPTENLDILLQGAYAKDEDNGYATTRYMAESLDCLMPTIVGSFLGIPRSSTRARGWICGEIKAPGSVAYDHEGLALFGARALEREARRASLSIDWTLPGDWLLTSISAYNTSWNINGYDNNIGVRTGRDLTIAYTEWEDFSQELRVMSPRDRKLRGLFGAYYYNVQSLPGYNVLTTVPTAAQAALGAVQGQKSRFDSGDEVTNKAVFAMLEYEFTDRFTASVEGRYQEDRIISTQEVDGSTPAVTPFINRQEETYTKFLPRVTGRYAINDNMNLYGSFAQGNKPGGFNSIPANANAASREALLALGLDTFEEEEVDSIELGLKGTFGGNRYSYNVAIFNLDWTKQQLTRSEPYQTTAGTFTTTPLIVNAGESSIRGLEVEINGRPTHWFDFRIAYAWAKAEFDDYYDVNLEELLDTDGQWSFLDSRFTQPNPLDTDGPLGQAKGNKIPQTGEHQASVSGTLRRDLPNNWSAFLRNDFTYESKRYTQTDNLNWAGDSFKWNLRAGIERDNMTVSLYVNNLLDDDTVAVVTRLADFQRTLLIPDPLTSFAGQQNTRLTFFRSFLVALPRKREIGMQLNYRF
jgi:iron complex outermembrane recepter protein